MSTPPPPPQWVTVVVILGMLALFGFMVIKYGPASVGVLYVIGGVMGVYGGVDHILRRKSGGSSDGGDSP